ncbi:TonB-dependent receptor [Maribacter polysaccharolyticus]|uniref:TonB-dependent receptor n=1 Tax=Maribacter polysaccharolyticus TaxID=3020831 RepID=UPI00237F76A5|nr:TonB-dependent receptor [Maribacter polysaccharolyticus]MDE3740349.1 TonB-dependent receptor [Maribacter polysaccharolyticus]
MKAWLIMFTLVFVQFTVQSQQCKSVITGVVTDFHDMTPLVRASVTLIGKKDAIFYTDVNGFFEIPDLCDGPYELEIYHPECQSAFMKVDLETNLNLNIFLEHHFEVLEEVKVTGNRVTKTNSAIEETLKLKTIEQYGSASLGDALKEINGISSLNTGANIVKPTIHGLSGSRVLVLNNGVRMQDMEWGAEHAPNVDVNAAGSISVIKGASALQYGGDAIGGVILIEQNRFAKKDSLFGKTILTGILNGRGGKINTDLTKTYENGWFVKGQASYKRLGDQEAPDYILSNTGVKEIGASLHFGKENFTSGWRGSYSFFNTEIGILSASHIGSVDDLIRAINDDEPTVVDPFTYDITSPRQEVTHHLGKFKYYKRYEGLGKFNVQYDFQNNRRYEYDVRTGDDKYKPSIDLELTTHTLTSDFKWDAKSGFDLTVGLMGRYQNNFANPDTGVRRLIPDYDKYDAGFFSIMEFDLGEDWKMDTGLRYDYSKIDAKKYYKISRWEERGYDADFSDIIIRETESSQYLTHPVFDYHNVSATLGVNYSTDNQHSLSFNYALANRAPNPSELFSDGLHHSAARIELGDLRITSETSHKASMSLIKDGVWGYTLEPYVNYINDFIYLEPTDVEYTVRGSFPVWEYHQTNARILGVDLSVYANWADHWRTDHKFSLTKGKDLTDDEPLINIPAANIRNKISFTTPWKNLEIGLESKYVFKQNETPEDIYVYSTEQQEDVLLEINSAPDAYHVLSLNSSMDFNFEKSTLTVSLIGTNILDVSYRDYLNRLRYYADDLGRNIILQFKLNY